MDVLLINGQSFSKETRISLPSIGLLYLATILKNHFKVDIFDTALEISRGNIRLLNDYSAFSESFVDRLLFCNPKIIGFTTMCDTYPFVLDIARKIKNKRRDVKIILGGPQASLTAQETMDAFDSIDLISIGESENTITDIVGALLADKSQQLSMLECIPNIIFRNSSAIITTAKNLSYVDPNNLPEIDDSFLEAYIRDVPAYSIDVGRGCPFTCSFCCTSDFWDRKFRMKPILKILSEMKQINHKYGINIFPLQHDLFTANRNNLHAFCDAFNEERIDATWGCSSRIDTIDYETIELMAKSGCKRIYLGIETGSAKMQEIIGKRLKLDDVVEKVRFIKKAGMNITCSFIFGFSDELESDLLDTISLIEKLICLDISNIQLHRFMPYPKTQELDRVFDKLYFDEENVNCHIFERRYTKDLKDIILSNKKIFSNFYEFDSEVRGDKWRSLPEFVALMRVTHKFFKYLYEASHEIWGGFVQTYHQYSKAIAAIISEIDINNTQINIEKEYYKTILDAVKIINDDIKAKTGNEFLQTMFDFGHDMLDFAANKEIRQSIKEYPFNAILLHKQGYYLDEKLAREPICVLFSKGEQDKLNFKRIPIVKDGAS